MRGRESNREERREKREEKREKRKAREDTDVSFSLSGYANTHAHTHTHIHAHTHAHTHKIYFSVLIAPLSPDAHFLREKSLSSFPSSSPISLSPPFPLRCAPTHRVPGGDEQLRARGRKPEAADAVARRLRQLVLVRRLGHPLSFSSLSLFRASE